MIDLLKSKKKIVINSDIDGILSGLILQEFLDCEIVGFCNSANKLWISVDQFEHRKDFVFIDMFVSHKNIACIDQHIVSFDEDHNKQLASNPNKINPNILRGKCFHPKSSYYTKYPFGTVHFIIAELERNTINLEQLLLFNENEELQSVDFFLRADDALITSVEKYKENALDWWNWLVEYSSNGKVTQQFIDYTYSGLNAWENKKQVERKLLAQPFCCEKPDGGFAEIADAANFLLPNFIKYVDYLAEITNLKPFDTSQKYSVVEGIPARLNFSHEHSEALINDCKVLDKKVFSYAFVKSYGQENSFSFTYFLE